MTIISQKCTFFNNFYKYRSEDLTIKKLKMARGVTLTFEEGYDLYLDSCRIRNLREGTINHYKQSYTQFYKFFDRNMLVSKITQKKYNEYILFLRSYIDNDVK